MSGKDRDGGLAMLAGVNLCVDRANKKGGINGRQIDVVVYDDQNNASQARKKALEIATDGLTLLVIGHYYSSTSLEGGSIYNQYGIPAITASATAPEVTVNNPWYFRIVPDTNLQGKLCAHYLKNVLQQTAANVVFETDAYGRTLKDAFVLASRDAGIQIKNIWPIDSQIDDLNPHLEAIIESARVSEPDALFVALQDHQAAKLVRSIRDTNIDLTIIGGDAIGSEAFQRKFVRPQQETSANEHYPDGIYAASFFIHDISNQKARHFSNTFKQQFGRKPDDMIATHFDAAAIALEAIRNAKISLKLDRDRRLVRDQLSRIRSMATSHRGITGRLFFDQYGNVVKSFPMGVYFHGRLISAPIQLGPLVNPEMIVDMRREIHAGNVLAVDDRFFFRTLVVYTGIDINQIDNINPRNGTYTADFYLWFRHKGYLDYGKIEFLNAKGDLHLLDEPIVQMTENDMNHRAYRIKREFKEAFVFHDYPFDDQTLSIRFRHKDFNSERLIFATDDIGMQRYSRKTPAERLQQSLNLSKKSEWHLKDILVYSDIGTADSTLGNPDMFHAKAETTINYSRFNIVTAIERNATRYVLKNLIPLFIVIFLGYIMLFISPLGPPFVARMSLGVTALLTAVFLRMEAAGQLPNIGYLVALDYLYFGVYVLILSGIAITVAKHRALRNGNESLAKKLDYFGRLFQPLFVIFGFGVFVYLY
jgi:branched-chain amino acid transport system substrate-binding protein